MIAEQLSRVKSNTRRAFTVLQGLVLVSATILPLMSASASAASLQLTNRLASVDTGVPGAATSITFQFRLPSSASPIQSMQIEFCDTPLGTCTSLNTPTIPVTASPPTVTITNWTTNATTFGTYTGVNGASGGTLNEMKLTRTAASAEVQSGSTDRTIKFTGLTNNAAVNKTYYPRIRLYSDAAWSTQVFDGATAQSTSQTLTINARVAEQLSFCIGTTITDAIGTNAASPMVNSGSTSISSCANADGTTVDLGSVSSSTVNVTPVAVASGGSNTNAYAMIQTNAQNGASIAYRAVQNSSSGRLKVAGATCTGTSAFDAGSSSTDQCFGSSTTQTAFSAGNEAFGMTVAGVGCYAVPSAAYTCTYTAGTSNLKPTATYQGQGTFGSSYVYGSSNGFTWDQSGTAVPIATSASVVANEALLLKFAAESSVTTPTGQYTTQADFIATPTY